MEQNNISFSINLSDSKEKIDELANDPNIHWSEYLRNIYNNNLSYTFHFTVISDAKKCCEDVGRCKKML